MPKRSYFVPDNYMPDAKLIEWAKKTFRIEPQEVLRQLELMKDHEFRRPYSCWNRVFRNWFRKAEEIESLRRTRQYRPYQEEEITPEERRKQKKQEDWLNQKLRAVD